MRYRYRLFLWVPFLLAGCIGSLARGTASSQPETTIRVDNQAFLDMTIYVLRGAERVRLGLAPGGTTTTFIIPADIAASVQQLRFIADPVGGARPSVSDQINVNAGDQVQMVIPPG